MPITTLGEAERLPYVYTQLVGGGQPCAPHGLWHFTCASLTVLSAVAQGRDPSFTGNGTCPASHS